MRKALLFHRREFGVFSPPCHLFEIIFFFYGACQYCVGIGLKTGVNMCEIFKVRENINIQSLSFVPVPF